MKNYKILYHLVIPVAAILFPHITAAIILSKDLPTQETINRAYELNAHRGTAITYLQRQDKAPDIIYKTAHFISKKHIIALIAATEELTGIAYENKGKAPKYRQFSWSSILHQTQDYAIILYTLSTPIKEAIPFVLPEDEYKKKRSALRNDLYVFTKGSNSWDIVDNDKLKAVHSNQGKIISKDNVELVSIFSKHSGFLLGNEDRGAALVTKRGDNLELLGLSTGWSGKEGVSHFVYLSQELVSKIKYIIEGEGLPCPLIDVPHLGSSHELPLEQAPSLQNLTAPPQMMMPSSDYTTPLYPQNGVIPPPAIQGLPFMPATISPVYLPYLYPVPMMFPLFYPMGTPGEITFESKMTFSPMPQETRLTPIAPSLPVTKVPTPPKVCPRATTKPQKTQKGVIPRGARPTLSEALWGHQARPLSTSDQQASVEKCRKILPMPICTNSKAPLHQVKFEQTTDGIIQSCTHCKRSDDTIPVSTKRKRNPVTTNNEPVRGAKKEKLDNTGKVGRLIAYDMICQTFKVEGTGRVDSETILGIEVTYYSHGVVRKQFKDGSIEITYPIGIRLTRSKEDLYYTISMCKPSPESQGPLAHIYASRTFEALNPVTNSIEIVYPDNTRIDIQRPEFNFCPSHYINATLTNSQEQTVWIQFKDGPSVEDGLEIVIREAQTNETDPIYEGSIQESKALAIPGDSSERAPLKEKKEEPGEEEEKNIWDDLLQEITGQTNNTNSVSQNSIPESSMVLAFDESDELSCIEERSLDDLSFEEIEEIMRRMAES